MLEVASKKTARPPGVGRSEWTKNSKDLFHAALAGNLPEVERLIPISDPDYFDWPSCATALHIAALKGHADVVEALLPFSDPKSVRSFTGETPLQLAIRCGNAGCAALIEQAQPAPAK